MDFVAKHGRQRSDENAGGADADDGAASREQRAEMLSGIGEHDIGVIDAAGEAVEAASG
jgi:hypothetical protein